MTTHDQQIAAETVTITPETSSARMEVPPAPQSEPPVHAAEPVAETETIGPETSSAGMEAAPAEPETVACSAEVQPSDDDMLFAVDPSALRSRWDNIQTAFVDDPSGCVQQADGLVEEVIGQLTSQFADARSHLEAQWARGETASTEDLRVALTRYREFFNRLLAV